MLGLGLGAVAVLAPVVVSPSTALHAFTAGSIATYGLGMMARVALGHTGRPLKAPRLVVIAFGAVVAAGLVRVAAPLTSTGLSGPMLGASSLLLALSFAVYFVVYLPVLIGPRPDGREG